MLPSPLPESSATDEMYTKADFVFCLFSMVLVLCTALVLIVTEESGALDFTYLLLLFNKERGFSDTQLISHACSHRSYHISRQQS